MDLRISSPTEGHSKNDPVSSTPVPERSELTDSPEGEASTSEVTVALVRPGNGMVSDNHGEVEEEPQTPEGSREIVAPATPSVTSVRTSSNQSESIVVETGQNSRPSSAPARTSSEGHVRTGTTPTILPFTCPPKFPRPVYPQATASMRTDFLNPHNTRGSSPAVQSSVDRDMSPEMESMRWTEEPEESGYRVSSDSDRPLYHCSYCSYSTPVFNNMRIHGSIHPDGKVMIKCTLCNFTTTRKSHMRHHRRLQHRRPANPAPTALHCDKCQFSTPVPNRMREHYSRLHNMDSGTSYIHTSILNMRTAAVNSTSTPINNRTATFTSDRGMYVDMNGHSRALHAFRLAQPRGTLQFDGDPLSSSTTSSILAGCMDPSYSPSLSGMSLRCDNDQHMMVNGVNQSSNQFAAPPTRVPITSTVTSLEYPARPANPHRPDLNCFSPLRTSHTSFRDFFTGPFTSSPSRTSRSTSILNTVTFTPQGQGDSGVKVKTEPIDCDGDVTSSGLISYYERERGGGFGVGMCPERPRRDAFNSSSQIRYRPYETVVSHSMDQGDEVGDASHVSQSSEAGSNENRAGSFMTGERGRSSVVADRGHSSVEDRDVSVNRHHHLLALIKTETSSVAVQCSGRSSSCFKSEVSAPTVTVAAAEHSTEATQGDGRQATEERGIQCELIASPPRRLSHSRLSTDSEQHSMSGCDSRCPHCGITFEDEVLFTIHIGCHSHTDPFVCNVCGKKCGNKYGFYSHITRGHHL